MWKMLNRRQFLQVVPAVAVVAAFPTLALATSESSVRDNRSLLLEQIDHVVGRKWPAKIHVMSCTKRYTAKGFKIYEFDKVTFKDPEDVLTVYEDGGVPGWKFEQFRHEGLRKLLPAKSAGSKYGTI